MLSLVLLVHILLCIGIISLVLLQQGKGADVGAAFGSGSSNSIFGSRGPASFLFKFTAFLVLMFFITSISLTYIQGQNAKAENQLTAPVVMPTIPDSSTQPVAPQVNLPLPGQNQ